MPVKTHKAHKKHPQHYVKVYWPYLPLVLVVGLALWLSYPAVTRSQRGVLSYETHISSLELLEATNKQRVQSNDRPLALNDKLNAAAQAKANDMAARNYWSHVTPDGTSPWAFVDNAGYQYETVAENLAYGFDNSNEVLRGWLNSPEHRQNLLSNNFSDVGFGIAHADSYVGKGAQTIVVALYAKPGSSSADTAVLGASNFAETNTSVNKAQTLTEKNLPWIGLAIGLIAGAAGAYLVLKHSVGLHRTLRKGEKFVLKHPVWDATILVIIALCAILGQSVGVIR